MNMFHFYLPWRRIAKKLPDLDYGNWYVGNGPYNNFRGQHSFMEVQMPSFLSTFKMMSNRTFFISLMGSFHRVMHMQKNWYRWQLDASLDSGSSTESSVKISENF